MQHTTKNVLSKLINAIFLFIATGSVFCGGQTLVTIPPSHPLGLWKPFDPQSIYPYLQFLPNDLVNLDSTIPIEPDGVLRQGRS
jgi:hypothetical protein